ncbi:mitochondrial import inner membrane translocase subunit Tim10 B-like [Amphiura filiformis]|uniref:mitochondrial import inner membrane translocase subunit Tim10 B-like n=1 Tax=Amphiura filiformis TaxID=82378 RepID=UPI003B20C14B
MQVNPDEAGRRNLRDFLQMYNKFTEECFTRCIQNLNYRAVTPEEQACTDRCATKLVNINHRLIWKYMEINPLNKQLAQLEAQAAQEQQQQVDGTATQGDVPQNLAAQVKDVFGEETQITDNLKNVVDGDKTVVSQSTNVDSNSMIKASTDSSTSSQVSENS